ncbi:hypothetical protein TH66_13710 [Carbonactinospora thermoautotrophica]|uniref:Uncharacterized protein n=1 Tax=Carbonactinospora thermoautotrophica TaxID=1469144 RepID=A0A132MQF2_9ACTN|nr:hypothetical protein TH66_13710 [Carbonactinospora thermoautotrophica]KWX10647.1 hypothetical protein TR74_02385 [Carbonactinospora thermoautotrophica]
MAVDFERLFRAMPWDGLPSDLEFGIPFPDHGIDRQGLFLRRDNLDQWLVPFVAPACVDQVAIRKRGALTSPEHPTPSYALQASFF